MTVAEWSNLFGYESEQPVRVHVVGVLRHGDGGLRSVLRVHADRLGGTGTRAVTDTIAAGVRGCAAVAPPQPREHSNPAYEQSGQIRQFHQTVESNRANAPLKIERKNLSISLETLRTSWPCLARAGFGLEQLEQIQNALAQLGKSTDRVVQGLDHAEWELAEGRMGDKTGQPVADPCAWVFRSLASQGYYRRPAGYVSAEEQAELDAALARAAKTPARPVSGPGCLVSGNRRWKAGKDRRKCGSKTYGPGAGSRPSLTSRKTVIV